MMAVKLDPAQLEKLLAAAAELTLELRRYNDAAVTRAPAAADDQASA